MRPESNPARSLVGFGNVARAFVGLLRRKQEELAHGYGIGLRITGIASRRLGCPFSPWLTVDDMA